MAMTIHDKMTSCICQGKQCKVRLRRKRGKGVQPRALPSRVTQDVLSSMTIWGMHILSCRSSWNPVATLFPTALQSNKCTLLRFLSSIWTKHLRAGSNDVSFYPHSPANWQDTPYSHSHHLWVSSVSYKWQSTILPDDTGLKSQLRQEDQIFKICLDGRAGSRLARVIK